MVRALATNPQMVRLGLDAIRAVRSFDLSVDGTKLRAAERQVREQILVGFDSRGPGSAPAFWVNPNVQHTLLRITGRKTIADWCRIRGHRVSAFRNVVRSMPESLPPPERKAHVIHAVDIVRGTQELLSRVPRAAGLWPTPTIRNAIAVWWGYRRTHDLTRVFQERGLIEDVRILNPGIAELLEGDSPELLARRQDHQVGSHISQFHLDLAATVEDLLSQQPDLQFASYEKRTSEIADRLGLKSRSVRRRLQRDPSILKTLALIRPTAWDFIVKSAFHHRVARAAEVVMREQTELALDSREQRFVALGAKIGISSNQIRRRLKKYPHIIGLIREESPDASAFITNPTFLQLLAASVTITLRDRPGIWNEDLGIRLQEVCSYIDCDPDRLSRLLKSQPRVLRGIHGIRQDAANFLGYGL